MGKILKKNLIEAAHQKRVIHIIEDCAQCYNGYMGSNFADVNLFSFGIIKTSTALGGGIAVVSNVSSSNNGHHNPSKLCTIAETMKRLQYSQYGQQTHIEYFTKIIKCSFILFL